MSEVEMCWRCPTPMAWIQSTWQCPRCHFKLGCCEGDPQTACDAPTSARKTEHSADVTVNRIRVEIAGRQLDRQARAAAR